MYSICVDFDGVIHSYTSGFRGIDVISDPPVEGAFDWLAEMINYFEVHIFSTRSMSASGQFAMAKWFKDHGMPEEVFRKFKFPEHKPAALIYIDDRAWRFNGPGTFPNAQEIMALKPWYKNES